ncbi:hypothetical protein J2X06_003450 [Lysobacter niastensis]|uniref:PNPLA domain-containing protein n=1 Tax=Lysobacter niastensis TaxID=380629 RepID=A0ABU1WFP2_9GAMM|nr:patatin-like phospholipase family protein [Lysobacter niastensis]MDR7136224.1 hypothetical protein [Lysobacter niastensis]
MTGQPAKYCDLVMKGGLTSGIVYPNAVLALAKEYRFKNIGGTSAGAIAAAVSAAAAMGDRAKAAGDRTGDRMPQHDANKMGFEGLAAVSSKLSSQGFIYGLFQPAKGARNAYRLIVILAGNNGALRKLLALLVAVVAIAPIETLLILAAFLGIGYWAADRQGVWAALAPALLCAYAGGALFSALRVARVARKNLLGLCTGLSPHPAPAPEPGTAPSRRQPKPALTQWLHGVLQELSGKPMAEPLTFADLHAAQRYDGEPKTKHAISLQVITTGVSHREPRTLPFNDANFWFLREEFDLLFPKSVVDWMVKQGGDSIEVAGKTFHPLPAGENLPVLVGMRMSLSFPLIISAVPLHEPAARSRKPRTEEPATQESGLAEKNVAESTEALATGGEATSTITAFRTCWFSDGGIASNFPIHLFDAALPLWPTFAINLVYPKTDDSDRPLPQVARTGEQQEIEDAVFLPTENNQGWQRTYQSITHPIAAKEVSGFLFAIIATMQNWRDLLQSRAPGQRDRIVHVSLHGDEGGMNLDMPQNVLTRISKKGTAAGTRFQAFSFENHYWVRWRNLASAYQRYTMEMAEGADCKPRIPAYAAAYATASSGSMPPSYRFSSQAKRDGAADLLGGLTEQGREWKDELRPDLTDGAPRPLPQMKITPTF